VCFLLFGIAWNVQYFRTPGLSYRKREFFSLLVPILILVLQLFYGLDILYRMTELDLFPELTIKITGHQWYWSYEISDLEGVDFDSFILPEDELLPGDPRLLAVDNRLVLPYGINLRLCITSDDVIHS